MAEGLCSFSQPWALSAALKAGFEQVLMSIHGQQRTTHHRPCVSRGVGGESQAPAPSQGQFLTSLYVLHFCSCETLNLSDSVSSVLLRDYSGKLEDGAGSVCSFLLSPS